MAAPPIGARVAPTGVMILNGHGAAVVFSQFPGLNIYEKSVQPFAVEGGDPIMTDTNLNAIYVTKAPQCLIEHDDSTIIANYDPGAAASLQLLVNNPQSITWLYPDGSAFAAWGYVRRVEYGPLVKNEPPEVTLTIVITNHDPVNCVEAGPVYFDGTGSCNAC